MSPGSPLLARSEVSSVASPVVQEEECTQEGIVGGVPRWYTLPVLPRWYTRVLLLPPGPGYLSSLLVYRLYVFWLTTVYRAICLLVNLLNVGNSAQTPARSSFTVLTEVALSAVKASPFRHYCHLWTHRYLNAPRCERITHG